MLLNFALLVVSVTLPGVTTCACHDMSSKRKHRCDWLRMQSARHVPAQLHTTASRSPRLQD